MDVYEAMKKRRTIRIFDNKKPVEREKLLRMVDAGRIAPTGVNSQPMRFYIMDNDEEVKRLFPSTRFGALLKGKHSPSPEQAPRAFIVLLHDSKVGGISNHNIGACAQSILLAGVAEGLGTCWMGAFDKDLMREITGLDSRYILDTIIAVGYPGEEPIMEDISVGSDINDEVKQKLKYYLDDEDVLHVPKRKLEDCIIK